MCVPVARIINLDSSVRRLADVTARLDKAGLAWTRHRAQAPASAASARAHPLYRGHRARALCDRDLNQGEIGCFLSHLDALRTALAGDDPLALVLEDDAVPLPGSAAALAVLSCWLMHQDSARTVSCIHLSRSLEKWQRPFAQVGEYHILRAYRPPLFFSAMLWTREGIAHFLRFVDRNGIDRPVDDAFRACFSRSGLATVLRTPIFFEEDTESTIGHAPRAKTWRTRQANVRRKLPEYLHAWYNMTRKR